MEDFAGTHMATDLLFAGSESELFDADQLGVFRVWVSASSYEKLAQQM